MNVAEWLREKRKKNIEEMLKHTDMLLTKVAEANDFNSLSTFSDYCKRKFWKIAIGKSGKMQIIPKPVRNQNFYDKHQNKFSEVRL